MPKAQPPVLPPMGEMRCAWATGVGAGPDLSPASPSLTEYPQAPRAPQAAKPVTMDGYTALPPAAPPARLPPHNDPAEMALLGAILQSNRAYERVSEFLRPEHFANRIHGRIFDAMGRLIERGQIADAITLRQYFERDAELNEVGGYEYLVELTGSVVSVVNAEDYAKVVHDLALRRELIAIGEEMVNRAFSDSLDEAGTDQIEAAEQKLFQLAETGEVEGGFIHFREAVGKSILIAEAAYRRAGQIAGVPSGFTDLDRLLGGLHNSDLLILAGRPSMGKTALATNIGFNVAREMTRDDAGRRCTVAFFSLEMSSEQLATRVLSDATGLPGEKIRRGDLSNEDFEKLVIASQELERVGLFIDDTPAITVTALRSRARRLKRQHGLSLIIVDYLQLMRPSAGMRSDNRVQEVSDITRGLKAIAKELDVPVIALSQLSRAVEQREDKRPQLADLRESGSIEQDADMVLFVFREEYYLARAEPTRRADEDETKFAERYTRWQQQLESVHSLAKVIVAKQRHGPIGDVTLRFDGETTRFSDYIPDDHLPANY